MPYSNQILSKVKGPSVLRRRYLAEPGCKSKEARMLMFRLMLRCGSRFASVALILAIILIGAMLRVPAAAIEKPGQPGVMSANVAPDGLVAVLTTEDLSNPSWRRAVKNPSISGVALQIRWSDIEQVQGKPDWTKLDDVFDAAHASGKWVQLLVFPGFFSPAWALASGSDGTPKTDIFPVQYGPEHNTPLPLPMPWDTVYLKRWYKFLEELSDKYGTSPAFKVMACSGPTSVSAEFTLPSTPKDVKQWQADGYTPDKWVDAWQKTFKACNTDFPNQFVSLSFGAGLPINNQGKIDQSERQGTKQTIIDEGMKALGHRFALQYSNLDGTTDPQVQGTQYLINTYAGSIITGLQLRTSAANTGMGADGNPPLALQLALNKGLALNSAGAHVNFLEIYARDVLAKDMQSVLINGASLIANGHPGPTPRMLPSRDGNGKPPIQPT